MKETSVCCDFSRWLFVLVVLKVSTHTHTHAHTRARARLKLRFCFQDDRLNRDDITEMMLDPDSDSDVADCDQNDSNVYGN
jgi:hypothetical protein